MSDTLTVAINAQVGGNTGGRGQFVQSLIAGLSRTRNRGVEYLLITNPEYADWPEQYLGDGMRVVSRPWSGWFERVKASVRPFEPILKPLVGPLLDHYRSQGSPSVPESDGFYESLDADVIHFPYRNWIDVDVPTVYNLGDLQHLHYPEFFDEETLEWRREFCPSGCHAADRVVTASDFVKRDISDQYGVSESKIQTIRRAAPTEFYADAETDDPDVRARYDLPENFMLYPSKKWPHKNHTGLLTAMERVEREYGTELTLVCTGANEPQEQYDQIVRQAEENGLRDHVHMLGFIDESELLALYRTAQFVVFPTLFEGQGFPLVEAFDMSTPVTCSSIPPLEEYGEDAALFFDPESIDDMAETIHQLATDSTLRDEYRSRSADRGQQFDWSVTAETYQAVYRDVAGESLSDREERLLAHNGLLDDSAVE
jgi:glycosyltransferase involved in cell wall biosynthesis